MEIKVDQTGKKLTNKIPTESWVISHTEPTSHTLLVPTCPMPPFHVLYFFVLKNNRSL